MSISDSDQVDREDMMIKFCAFLCIAHAQRNENEEENLPDLLSDPNFYRDQLIASKEKASRAIGDRKPPFRIPVVLDNEHADGDWTSSNNDSCSYVEQADGSILINTMHPYEGKAYCHEYWECKDPNHKMFFKWNRVQIQDADDCWYDWARFAWGIEDTDQEFLCTETNDISDRQQMYRNTGGSKIVWDFTTNGWDELWGAEAQIICKDPRQVNECVDGTHECSMFAECINESGKAGYTCQCPSESVKWGDKTIKYSGTGTLADPCKLSHPDFPEIEIFPIEWNGETHGVVFEGKRYFTWQRAFERCNELSMTLPLPSNAAENTALTNFLLTSDSKRIFLGAHNSNDERKWVNLYTNEEIIYSQWSINQPDNTGKVAEMWTDNGDWNDISLSYKFGNLICIKVEYENWKPSELDLGEYYCETGLNACHITSTCADYTGTSDYKEFQCECSDRTIDGVELTKKWSTVPEDEPCQYTHPDYRSNVLVSIFTYNGKPTMYHQVGATEFERAVEYCASGNMHLPVPNTEQEYQDLKAIPRFKRHHLFWLGFTDVASEGKWLNYYNDEELAIDHWAIDAPNNAGKGEHNVEMAQYAGSEWNDVKSNANGHRTTLCISTNLKIDYCGKGLHDCSSDAICTNADNSFTCTCPTIEINDWVLEPASISTGKIGDGCHYYHPIENDIRLHSVNYRGRTTVVYIGAAAGSNLYHHAKKCHSMGMRMLTPVNSEETTVFHQVTSERSDVPDSVRVPIGITRRWDGQWRDIYTGQIAWTNFRRDEDTENISDFVYTSGDGWWKLINYEDSSLNLETGCVALEDAESNEVDFCATGFNDCHEGSSCINGGENGYTCKCQPLPFGDVSVAPIDDTGTGKTCIYNMPDHDDKTLIPIRVLGSDTVYAFHIQQSLGSFNLLEDTINYCKRLNMHLPLPQNAIENQSIRKLQNYKSDSRFFWLGFSSGDSKYLNFYTGEEVSFQNWDEDEPRNGTEYTNVGFKEDGNWATYADKPNYYIQKICQKSSIDISKINWCTPGLHNCNVNANCLSKKTKFECECKESYTGDGIGENGCTSTISDPCGQNLHDCSKEAICTNVGSGFTCTCSTIQINDWVLKPAPTSSGKGVDGCHYYHPEDKEIRLHSLNYGGRDTVVYYGPAIGSTRFSIAAKCNSLGMRMLTPENEEESLVLRQLIDKTDEQEDIKVALGITRQFDGQWRNIYTNKKSWTNFGSKSKYIYFYGKYDFVQLNTSGDWSYTTFDFSSQKARTVCVAPEKDEPIEIDFCGTGFNDCHEGASCINGGYDGFTCECQSIQFGDAMIAPIDDAGTGKDCIYKMPGHDDKTILPLRSEGTVHAFHVSDIGQNLQEAVNYCDEFGMQLPTPKNEQENMALTKMASFAEINGFYSSTFIFNKQSAFHFFFWLGFSDSDEDLKYLNIYTGEEISYSSWKTSEPRGGMNEGGNLVWFKCPDTTCPLPRQNTNVGMKRNGKWIAYVDDVDNLLFYHGYTITRTICQKPITEEQKQPTKAPATTTTATTNSNVMEFLPSVVKKMNEVFTDEKWTKFSLKWTDLSQKFNDQYLKIAEKGCKFSNWWNTNDIDAINCRVSNLVFLSRFSELKFKNL